MNMDGVSFLTNFLLLPFIYVHVVSKENITFDKYFVKTLDCKGEPGCAIDQPSDTLQGIRSKLQCASACLEHCINFNYLKPSGLCRLFELTPFKITNVTMCTSYDSHLTFGILGENLSKYRRTCQSSTYCSRSNITLSSWIAVDGLYGTAIKNGDCSHTNNNDLENNWFMVDLVRYVIVSYVRILTRDNDGTAYLDYRYRYLTIGVTNVSWLVKEPIRNQYPICGVYGGIRANATWIRINCKATVRSGRYVIVHQMPMNDIDYGGFMALCEVEIFGTF